MRAMAEHKFTSFRLNYWLYDDNKGLLQQLKEVRPALKDIADACKDLGLSARYQNHSRARFIGSSTWDLYELIRHQDHRYIGVSFDIGHATVEGSY